MSSKTLIDSEAWRSHSPQTPLKRGAKFFKVPLIKGDLGGLPTARSANRKYLIHHERLLKHPLNSSIPNYEL
ncbi:MAG: hypothetical protein EAZ77_13000 [Nostocales cyanobacterium]|nr:MAG: hypothetical protein EAZ77_13000 [Nostocales cyanobacterium]